MKKVEMAIDGMMCGMCEAHIKDAIRKRFPDAKKMTANHTTGEASFLLEEDMPVSVVEHEIKSVLDSMGYRLLDVTETDAPKKKGLFGFGKK